MMPTNQRHKPILARKLKAFGDELLANPKQSATDAAEKVYDVANRNVARSIATENMSKPALLQYLNSHSEAAEATIVEVMLESRKRMKTQDLQAAQFAKNALDSSDSILDRLHGKATQRIEQHTQVVSISIDLTQEPDQTAAS